MSSLYEDLEALVAELQEIISNNEEMLKDESKTLTHLSAIQGFRDSTEWRVKEISELLEKHNSDKLGVLINQNWESP